MCYYYHTLRWIVFHVLLYTYCYIVIYILNDVDRGRSRSSPKTYLCTEAGVDGAVEAFSRCEVPVTGNSILHPQLQPPLSSTPVDVPLTAVDADRIVQSEYLSPYCTEILLRFDFHYLLSIVLFVYLLYLLYLSFIFYLLFTSQLNPQSQNYLISSFILLFIHSYDSKEI